MTEQPPRDDLAIQTMNLRVDYGEYRAVRDVNLHVPRGVCFGLIGPNGAGKTSTIKVMGTLMKPTHGRVFIEGVDTQTDPDTVHKSLGYMPDMAPVSEDLKVWEFMEVFAGAYFINRKERVKRMKECIARVKLSDKWNSMCTSLSRGMQQRLVLAKTMLHKPKVYLLDEPASGLDPLARANFRSILHELAEDGNTILISSHILTELTEICNSIGIMQRGDLLIQGPVHNVIQKVRPHFTIDLTLLNPTDRDHAETILKTMEHITDISGETERIVVESIGDENQRASILNAMIEQGIQVKSFVNRQINLEDIFFQLGAHETA